MTTSGGLAFAREIQPSAMKLARPPTEVPRSVTGMGNSKMFDPSEIFFMKASMVFSGI